MTSSSTNVHGTRAPAQYCTFRLGDLTLGIEVGQVQEVLRQGELTAVPLAPAHVRGLINLRGQIVTAIDMRPQLGLGADGLLGACAVVQAGDETISLLVDEVGDVVSPPADDYEEIPAGVPERVRAVVSGTYQLTGRLLLVLDLSRLASQLVSL